MTIATVKLWGRRIGAVRWVEPKTSGSKGYGEFQYDPAFIRSGIQVAPLTMPLSDQVFSFPALSFETFKGLPGLLSDSLPDKFGNALIDAWLARQGRSADNFNPVERLCYTGTRGMGALEFEPETGVNNSKSAQLNVAALVELASEILSKRDLVDGRLDDDQQQALTNIIRVGTSAGGARAKAVIALNPVTKEVRSGEAKLPDGFEHWLLKFDGVRNNRDKELADPAGFGRIEYAYHLMAKAAGIEMMDCQLLEENGRAHFMTRRYDRPGGAKVHVQSLGGIAHYDFNASGAHSYEQAFLVMKKLDLPVEQREQQFLRALFGVVSRNQDDHVKNIAFLMDKKGQWSLSPAFDVTYAFNPEGEWTHQHQMTINGKQKGFTVDDFKQLAKVAGLKSTVLTDCTIKVMQAMIQWPEFAAEAGVDAETAEGIGRQHLTASNADGLMVTGG